MKKKEIIKRLEALEAIVNHKTVLESGWYKSKTNNTLFYFNLDENTLYGFGVNGWLEKGNATNNRLKDIISNYTKATTQEVEQRLIEEAKRRGLVKGVGVKCLADGEEKTITEAEYYFDRDHKETFLNNFCLDTSCIMLNGKWAEVIETTPTFKPVFMKCTQEQFDRMRPKLESVGCKFQSTNNWNNDLLANNVLGEEKRVGFVVNTSRYNEQRTEVHTEAEFLEACGYVEETTVETAFNTFEQACKEAKREPKFGDVVKAWSEDESDSFVYGKLEHTDKAYLVSGNWYKNIEVVTEININDFKK